MLVWIQSFPGIQPIPKIQHFPKQHSYSAIRSRLAWRCLQHIAAGDRQEFSYITNSVLAYNHIFTLLSWNHWARTLLPSVPRPPASMVLLLSTAIFNKKGSKKKTPSVCGRTNVPYFQLFVVVTSCISSGLSHFHLIFCFQLIPSFLRCFSNSYMSCFVIWGSVMLAYWCVRFVRSLLFMLIVNSA